MEDGKGKKPETEFTILSTDVLTRLAVAENIRSLCCNRHLKQTQVEEREWEDEGTNLQ